MITVPFRSSFRSFSVPTSCSSASWVPLRGARITQASCVMSNWAAIAYIADDRDGSSLRERVSVL